MVNEQSGVPIYLQIVEGMKREILTGIFGPDDRLPSIRDLALDLKVNPNTIAKSYQELETLGVIYFRRGQGAFVAPRTEEDRMSEARQEIMKRFTEILDIAERMGLSREALRSLLEEGLKKSSAHHKA
ncbi:MAG: GntR family transcriptional regulator [Candidatus Ozemobacteraceae bacterium]